jgi:DNA-binding transcriptional ArsR family regulator
VNGPPGQELAERAAVARELSDPLRLAVVELLAERGPLPVSRLSAELQVGLPRLSSHLRRLRDAGLVVPLRNGRQVTYALAVEGVVTLIDALDDVAFEAQIDPSARDGSAGGAGAGSRQSSGPGVRADALTDAHLRAHTCYDHLAGRLGVELYRVLRERGAVVRDGGGAVALGPAANELLPAIGIEPDWLRPGRRRLAFECLDVVAGAPHLGGVLGDALTDGLHAKGWIELVDGSRVVNVSRRGLRELHSKLGIELVAA